MTDPPADPSAAPAMRLGQVALVVAVTVGATAVLTWAMRSLDPQSVLFAFVVVWAPMAWLGTVSRVVPPQFPTSWHRLRPFERTGRCYELVGVKVAKRLLRRGPIAAFNRGLHLPADPSAQAIERLDQRMRVAEASHLLLFVGTLGIVVHAAVGGWWAAAAWTLLFDLAMNGYPVMLQRYNRALLQQRYADVEPPAR